MNEQGKALSGDSRRVRMTKTMLKNTLIGMLEKNTISKITVRALCAEADINRSTFYAYYADLFALLEEIEDEVIGVTPRINLYTESAYKEVLSEFFEFVDENRRVIKVLFENSEGNRFRSRILNKVFGRDGDTSDWIAGMKINDKMHFMMLMSAFGGISMVEKWVRGEIKASPEELSSALADFLEKR